MVDPARLDEIGALLERRFGLDALWLFGSEAQGRARRDSDVDLGALFRRRVDPLEVYDVRAEAAAMLGRPVDLVDLEAASPVLAMQVLRHGRLLERRDPRRVERFVARTLVRYDDLKLVRRSAEEALRRRLPGG